MLETLISGVPFMAVQLMFCTTPSHDSPCKNCSIAIQTIVPQMAAEGLEERMPLSNLHKVALSAIGKGNLHTCTQQLHFIKSTQSKKKNPMCKRFYLQRYSSQHYSKIANILNSSQQGMIKSTVVYTIDIYELLVMI